MLYVVLAMDELDEDIMYMVMKQLLCECTNARTVSPARLVMLSTVAKQWLCIIRCIHHEIWDVLLSNARTFIRNLHFCNRTYQRHQQTKSYGIETTVDINKNAKLECWRWHRIWKKRTPNARFGVVARFVQIDTGRNAYLFHVFFMDEDNYEIIRNMHVHTMVFLNHTYIEPLDIIDARRQEIKYLEILRMS